MKLVLFILMMFNSQGRADSQCVKTFTGHFELGKAIALDAHEKNLSAVELLTRLAAKDSSVKDTVELVDRRVTEICAHYADTKLGWAVEKASYVLFLGKLSFSIHATCLHKTSDTQCDNVDLGIYGDLLGSLPD